MASNKKIRSAGDVNSAELQQEMILRQEGDSYLQSQIEDIKEILSQDEQEVLDRQEADAYLQSQIEDLQKTSSGDTTEILDLLQQESDTRLQTDQQLQQAIDTIEGEIEGLTTTVNTPPTAPTDVNASFSGFSSRFNEAFSAGSVVDAINKIVKFAYLSPLVSLSASGSGTVREKGTPVTAVSLSAAVTKRSDDIARIQFFKDGIAIAGADFNPPTQVGTASTNYNWTGSFSDNATFRVDVRDNGASGGPTTISSSAAFTFVYPYYSGTGAPSRTAAQVAAMSKNIVTSNPTMNRAFTPLNGDVFYFAYPESYGPLTSILDPNNFETVNDWLLRTENITGLDGTSQSYRIYEFKNPVVAGSTSYTFKR
jgi:hypothetical protein